MDFYPAIDIRTDNSCQGIFSFFLAGRARVEPVVMRRRSIGPGRSDIQRLQKSEKPGRHPDHAVSRVFSRECGQPGNPPRLYPHYISGEDEKFLSNLKKAKRLWERFSTAIKSAGPTSIIVVENHSHPALTST